MGKICLILQVHRYFIGTSSVLHLFIEREFWHSNSGTPISQAWRLRESMKKEKLSMKTESRTTVVPRPMLLLQAMFPLRCSMISSCLALWSKPPVISAIQHFSPLVSGLSPPLPDASFSITLEKTVPCMNCPYRPIATISPVHAWLWQCLYDWLWSITGSSQGIDPHKAT
jgi:hypothetical protein